MVIPFIFVLYGLIGASNVFAQDVARETIVTAKQLPPAKDTSYQWKFMALAGGVVLLTGVGLLFLIKKQVNVNDQE